MFDANTGPEIARATLIVIGLACIAAPVFVMWWNWTHTK